MKRVLLFGILVLSTVAPGYSQLVSFGVKAGVPLNDALQTVGSFSTTGTTTETGRWLIGPTAEIHLPFRLSFEADALYRQENYSISSGYRNTINNWQFPFLGKYDFRGEVVRPFVDAGVTYRHLYGGAITDADNAGFTIGGGLTAKLLFLRLSPEIRYTRWGGNAFVNVPTATQSQNQVDFLVGFTF